MPDLDLSTYDAAALDALRVQVLTEQERRTKLATIPGTIQQLAEEYVAGGGDPANLTLTAPAEQ